MATNDMERILNRKATATFSMPPEAFQSTSLLTHQELASRVLVLWAQSIKFLNEIAPHGYLIEAINMKDDKATAMPIIVLELWVCAADHRRICSEWNTPIKEKDGASGN